MHGWQSGRRLHMHCWHDCTEGRPIGGLYKCMHHANAQLAIADIFIELYWNKKVARDVHHDEYLKVQHIEPWYMISTHIAAVATHRLITSAAKRSCSRPCQLHTDSAYISLAGCTCARQCMAKMRQLVIFSRQRDIHDCPWQIMLKNSLKSK